MGMGKGAGNLSTELLVEHMNLFFGKKYRTEPLLSVIDRVINQIMLQLRNQVNVIEVTSRHKG